ncbi:MAG: phosphate-binding protein, partial [Aeromonas veronii]
SPMEQEFVKMMLSKAGQNIVAKDGYVPVPAKVVQADLKKLGIM